METDRSRVRRKISRDFHLTQMSLGDVEVILDHRRKIVYSIEEGKHWLQSRTIQLISMSSVGGGLEWLSLVALLLLFTVVSKTTSGCFSIIDKVLGQEEAMLPAFEFRDACRRKDDERRWIGLLGERALRTSWVAWASSFCFARFIALITSARSISRWSGVWPSRQT